MRVTTAYGIVWEGEYNMPRGKSSVNQELLSAALLGLEAQRKKIEEQIREVQAMLGRRPGRQAAASQAAPAKSATRRRQLSPAARKRIAAAQKRRWAEYRKREGQKQ